MDAGHGASGMAGGAPRRFIASRWHGSTPLATLFWRDMLLVGTTVNAATSLTAIGMLAARLPLAAALCVFFAPLPYNVFLAFAVWRTAEKRGGPFAFAYQAAGMLWLIASTVA